MKFKYLLVLIALAGSFFVQPAFANHVKTITVPANSVGTGYSGSTVVAEDGAIVYVKSAAVVLYWPGSILTESTATSQSVACNQATVSARDKEDLVVGKGSRACAEAGSVVVAQFGSTIIYEDDVVLVRRPVVRRR